ncbi:MAG: TIGR01212 family radical SAM protein [Clostridia bacterium]|nr:TIGR01212 family radical SAM protein [Clostridia bacterium]
MKRLYYPFSQFLLERYGAKVYKLPVNIPCTCPNRDGTKSRTGCIFCGEEGAGFETHSSEVSVKDQLLTNMAYIHKKYKATRFIAYFQSYSSTYLPADVLERYLEECLLEGIVGIYVSTRPDCIEESHIEIFNKCVHRGLDVVVELGLQSVNENTLLFINRGHTVKDYVEASKRLHAAGIATCAHIITDIPSDSMEDVVACAHFLNRLGTQQVKCHSLYVLDNTGLGSLYKKGQFKPLELSDYLERTIAFVEHLHPDIAVQRLIGRAPEERTLYANFGMSWWKVLALLEEKMSLENRFQGRLA